MFKTKRKRAVVLALIAFFCTAAVTYVALSIYNKWLLDWIVGPFCILGCLYLAFGLPLRTQEWFLEWNAAGLVVYFLYGMRKSRLARGKA